MPFINENKSKFAYETQWEILENETKQWIRISEKDGNLSQLLLSKFAKINENPTDPACFKTIETYQTFWGIDLNFQPAIGSYPNKAHKQFTQEGSRNFSINLRAVRPRFQISGG